MVISSSEWLKESLRKQHEDLFSEHSCPMSALDPMSEHTCTEVSTVTSPRSPVSTQRVPKGQWWAISSRCSETSRNETQQQGSGTAAQVHAIGRGEARLPRTSGELEKRLKHGESHQDKQTAKTSDYTYI